MRLVLEHQQSLALRARGPASAADAVETRPTTSASGRRWRASIRTVESVSVVSKIGNSPAQSPRRRQSEASAPRPMPPLQPTPPPPVIKPIASSQPLASSPVSASSARTGGHVRVASPRSPALPARIQREFQFRSTQRPIGAATPTAANASNTNSGSGISPQQPVLSFLRDQNAASGCGMSVAHAAAMESATGVAHAATDARPLRSIFPEVHRPESAEFEPHAKPLNAAHAQSATRVGGGNMQVARPPRTPRETVSAVANFVTTTGPLGVEEFGTMADAAATTLTPAPVSVPVPGQTPCEIYSVLILGLVSTSFAACTCMAILYPRRILARFANIAYRVLNYTSRFPGIVFAVILAELWDPTLY